MVMGGNIVRPGNAPFTVALRANVDLQAFSSGVIVGRDWILTARHSVNDVEGQLPLDSYSVWTGTKGPQGDRKIDGWAYRIKRAINAPQWDVALLQLTQPVDLPGLPIALNPDRILIDTDAWLAGWGYTNSLRGKLPLNLQYIAVTTRTGCSDDDFLCTPGIYRAPRLEPPGGGALNGDSGGPLYTYDGKQPPLLIGVYSGGDTDEKRRPPHTRDARLYTRVSAVYSWLREYIG